MKRAIEGSGYPARQVNLARDRLRQRIETVTKLRRDDDVGAPASNSLAEDRFTVAATVHVGRVEKIDAEIERLVNSTDRFAVVDGTPAHWFAVTLIGAANRPATQAYR